MPRNFELQHLRTGDGTWQEIMLCHNNILLVECVGVGPQLGLQYILVPQIVSVSLGALWQYSCLTLHHQNDLMSRLKLNLSCIRLHNYPIHVHSDLCASLQRSCLEGCLQHMRWVLMKHCEFCEF